MVISPLHTEEQNVVVRTSTPTVQFSPRDFLTDADDSESTLMEFFEDELADRPARPEHPLPPVGHLSPPENLLPEYTGLRTYLRDVSNSRVPEWGQNQALELLLPPPFVQLIQLWALMREFPARDPNAPAPQRRDESFVDPNLLHVDEPNILGVLMHRYPHINTYDDGNQRCEGVSYTLDLDVSVSL